MWMQEAVWVAVSLNHDIIPSFWLHKWPRTTKSEPSIVGITVWGYCHMSMESISMCSNTCICLMCMWEAVWVGCEPQPWHNDIILTPQVTQNPKCDTRSVGITVWGYFHMPMGSISMCLNTLYMSNVDVGSSLSCCQPQPWCNDIILPPQVTQNPRIWAKKCGYNSLRLLPYTHGQHINVLKHFVFV